MVQAIAIILGFSHYIWETPRNKEIRYFPSFAFYICLIFLYSPALFAFLHPSLCPLFCSHTERIVPTAYVSTGRPR